MKINNQIKEHVVRKNIYDVSSMIALLGTLIALCTCMLKMYTGYKLDGYLGYFDADKELIGLNDSFSLYAVSVLAFGTVLFLFYSLMFNRLWKNNIFSRKYLFKRQKGHHERVNYLVAFIFMIIIGEIIVSIWIPFLEISERYESFAYYCGGVVLFLILLSVELIGTMTHKHNRESIDTLEVFGKENVDYVAVFDDCVMYFVAVFLLSLCFVFFAPFFGRDLAEQKKDLYLVDYNGSEYVVVYTGDNTMLLERCEYEDTKLDIFTSEQILLEKRGYVLKKRNYTEVTVL